MFDLLDTIGPWLVGIVMFGLPVLLAWWLTDGFAGWQRVDPPNVTYRPMCDPHTGQYVVVPVDEETGWPIAMPHSY